MYTFLIIQFFIFIIFYQNHLHIHFSLIYCLLVYTRQKRAQRNYKCYLQNVLDKAELHHSIENFVFLIQINVRNHFYKRLLKRLPPVLKLGVQNSNPKVSIVSQIHKCFGVKGGIRQPMSWKSNEIAQFLTFSNCLCVVLSVSVCNKRTYTSITISLLYVIIIIFNTE